MVKTLAASDAGITYLHVGFRLLQPFRRADVEPFAVVNGPEQPAVLYRFVVQMIEGKSAFGRAFEQPRVQHLDAGEQPR